MNAPLRVLIVEDSAEEATLLVRQLRLDGYQPVWERVDTREAMVAALERGPWDAVLSDHEMPCFSAPAALAVLRESGLETPLIVVSGVLPEGHASNLMRAGARDFVSKNRLERLGTVIDREMADAKDRAARKVAEKARQESDELSGLLLASTAEGIFGLDQDGCITFVNAACTELLRYPDAGVLRGKPLGEIYSSPDTDGRTRSPGECPIRRAGLSGERVCRTDEYFRCADGTRLPVAYSASPIRNAGNLKGAVVSFQDLTGRRRAEESQRSSDERFRELAENIDEVFWMMNPGGTEMLYISPGYERIWGRTRESLYREPMSWAGSIHPDDRQDALSAAAKQLSGTPAEMTYRIQRPDGGERWIRNRAFAIRDAAGQLLRVAGIAEDVSERKRSEDALRRAESRFQQLTESSIMGFLVGDFDGLIVEANDALLHMLGYTGEDLRAGRIRWDVFIPPEKMAEASEVIRQLRTSGSSLPWRTEAIRSDGSRIPILQRLMLVKGQEGLAMGYMLDLTDQTKGESAQAFLGSVVQSSDDAIVGKGLDGSIASWNVSAERLYGYSAEEIHGRPNSIIVPPDRVPELHHIDEVVSRGESIRNLETERLRKDGTRFWVSLTVSPIRDPAGCVTGLCSVARDITDQKRTQATLLSLTDAAESAEAANRAKSVFLANMSHEIRTPLNAILGYSQLMLRDSAIGAEGKRQLGIINRSGDHLLALINDILDMSRIEAGRAQLNEAPFDPAGMLEDLASMFQLRTKAGGLEFELVLEQIRDRAIVADEGKIRQVLINLLGNAVKFTKRGRIRLLASLGRKEGNLWLSATVEDTGVGISAEEQGLLFRPFVQAQNGHREQSGTGLGLAISREHARLMGGDITMRSEAGKGSSFRFEIPVEEAGAAGTIRPRERRRAIGLSAGQPIPHVLIVDDEETNRDWLHRLLTSVGFSVSDARSGGEAIEMWEKLKPRLILMDMRMPAMDGAEASRRIRALQRGERPVIIALSASIIVGDRKRMIESGADDFLSKPCQENELLEKIRTHLGLTYDYWDEPQVDLREPPANTPAVWREHLRELPADQMELLAQAISEGDKSGLDGLIRGLRGHENGLVAQGLQELADKYQYETLNEVLAQACAR